MSSRTTSSTRPSVADLLAANPVWLAPMAGVTDPPFRALCRGLGAGLSYTEMVSAKGLEQAQIARDRRQARGTLDSEPVSGDDGPLIPEKRHHINNSERLLMLNDGERPSAVQLFGSEPELLGRQARRVAEMLGPDLALIDLNAGCPVPKVFGRMEGSGLMADPDHAAQIVRAMVEGVADYGVPITVKMRRGVDPAHDNAVEFAHAVVAAGASAVAVHGRFRSEYYRGRSSRDAIAQVVRALDVPVLASGDVMSAADAVEILAETGAAGVLVARGAMGNPWIFRQIAQLRGGEAPQDPTAHERFEALRSHARDIHRYFGERALVRMRRHANWYVSGLPGASHFRGQVNAITTLQDLDTLIAEYEAYLATHDSGA